MKTYERLIYLMDGPIDCDDSNEIITELLSLREQKKALIEDAERLAKFALDTVSHDWKEVVSMTFDGHKKLIEILKQHFDLLKELEAK